MSKEFTDAIVKKITDVIKNNPQCLPAGFKEYDALLVDINSDNFVLNVDAKIHLQIDGIACDFEIHYPESVNAQTK
jgi:hypothetical protein